MILSIIFLYFISRSIGNLAVKKGQKPITWKVTVILVWLAGEFFGELLMIGLLEIKDISSIPLYQMILFGIFGLGMGYLGYLLVRGRLERMPDEEVDTE